jgi:signal transduction histidine kinase
VDNAIRHTPSGGAIDVDVSADGIVRVADDGPGVPEGERESIFRRFWRRDRTQAESRGLGLAIVARVAETHDGSVTVENRPGGGAVFTLRVRPVAGLTAAN